METEKVLVEFGRPYILRMPSSEAMMSCRKHGHLQKLQVVEVDYQDGKWPKVQFFGTDDVPYDSGYTVSEVGLYRDYSQPGNVLYAYLPDLSEDPEKIQRDTAKCVHDLHVILVNAGAIEIK